MVFLSDRQGSRRCEYSMLQSRVGEVAASPQGVEQPWLNRQIKAEQRKEARKGAKAGAGSSLRNLPSPSPPLSRPRGLLISPCPQVSE